MDPAVKNDKKPLPQPIALMLFLLMVLGVGLTLGFLTGPDAWYASLTKPFFNPPNVVFGPAWTILYILIAVAGWRVWRVAPNSIAMGLWVTQMLLNWLWSPVFFWAHQPGTALAIIILLLISILLFIIRAQKHDKLASQLFIPYAAWVGFASTLNAAIYWLN